MKNTITELKNIQAIAENLIVKFYLQAIISALLALFLYVSFTFSIEIIELFNEMTTESLSLQVLGSAIAFLLIICSGVFTFYAFFNLMENIVKFKDFILFRISKGF